MGTGFRLEERTQALPEEVIPVLQLSVQGPIIEGHVVFPSP